MRFCRRKDRRAYLVLLRCGVKAGQVEFLPAAFWRVSANLPQPSLAVFQALPCGLRASLDPWRTMMK